MNYVMALTLSVLAMFGCITVDEKQIIYSPATPEHPQSGHSITGIFSFGKGENFPNSSSLQLDYVSGMSSIFTWASLEPQEGKYDFNELEKQLDWAAKNNKVLNICLYAGNLSPAWIASRGVQMIQWKSELREDQAKWDKNSNGILTAPAFWDRKYLNYWKRFVSTFANRYRGRAEIGYISVTGATPKDLSTGTVIKNEDDWKKLEDLGYTFERHLAAWQDLVDHFVSEFPEQELVLALGPMRPGGGSTLKLSEDLVDYILRRKYERVHFLCVILNDSWFKTSPVSIELRKLFKKANKHGYGFGYQMIYSAERMEKFENQKNKLLRDYKATLDIAIEDGASWIELWHDDIIDPRFRTEGKPNLKYSDQIKDAAEILTSFQTGRK